MNADWKDRLDQARDGDLSHRGELLDAHRDYLLHIAQAEMDAGLRPIIGASDLVQASLTQAHAAFASFRGNDPTAIRAWLRQILLNELARVRRTQNAQKRRPPTHNADTRTDFPADPNAQTASKTIAQREELERLQAALALLSEDYRHIITMRSFEHRSFEEIATRLGRTPDAVRKLWGRAIDALRQRLEASA